MILGRLPLFVCGDARRAPTNDPGPTLEKSLNLGQSAGILLKIAEVMSRRQYA
jgi:hypothetical protein